MNDNRVNEIKKEDKKAFKGFAIVVIISSILGGILGASSVYLKEVLGDSIPNFLTNVFEVITPYANIVLTILMIIVYKFVYSKCRKEYNLWKEKNEDDDTIDKIEEKVSYMLLLTSVNMIIGFFFFGIGGMLLPFEQFDGEFSIIKILCYMIGFILCISATILIQNKLVNFEKEMNPLLKGSIYDIKFSQKFLESCDEASKLGIYKSAYKAYKSVNITCIILWMVCVLGYDLWNFGVIPMVMVIIIWLVQTISYCMESIKCLKAK